MASTPPAAPAKADLGKRLIAAIIDGVLAAGVSFVPLVGGIIGGLYLLHRHFTAASHCVFGSWIFTPGSAKAHATAPEFDHVRGVSWAPVRISQHSG